MRARTVVILTKCSRSDRDSLSFFFFFLLMQLEKEGARKGLCVRVSVGWSV